MILLAKLNNFTFNFLIFVYLKQKTHQKKKVSFYLNNNHK